MPEQADKTTHRADAIWIASIVSLVLVVVAAIGITLLTVAPGPADTSPAPTPDTAAHAGHDQHTHPHQPSHADFFTNGGRYMPRTHCLLNEAGQPDWPWIILLITLALGVIAAYIRIYLFWCKSYFEEQPRDRNPKLMHLAQVFLWCAVTGYAASVLMFFWPGYRLVGVCLLFLNLWAWRFCFNLSDLRVVFSADRYRRMADIDTLTGLHSRDGIKRLLNNKLVESGDATRPAIALLYINLDRFKLVNDGISHEAGNQLLTQVADRLNHAATDLIRDRAVGIEVGRCAGDEFVMLVDQIDDDTTTQHIARYLHDTLTSTYHINSHAVHLSVSIGVTTHAHGYDNADDMLRDADTAMYQAKRAGRGRSVWFDQAMHHAVRDAVELENDLRQALERDELFLTYQPIIDLDDGSVTGFEALIRWRHPERGLVRPDQFIPIAEESLLIRPIGRWVIREALEQAKVWRQRFPELANMLMNVNLSRVQFADAGLTQYLVETTRQLGLPNDALCLEITESTIMQDNHNALGLLRRFRELGFKLAMDDFGTGYSSLSHLHEFPLDALKIDKSFIANLSDNRDYAAVINAITALAGNLGFSVVAEGLETPEQVAELQALACHKGQGYFFHKPAEPAVIEAYLSDREQRGRAGAQSA